METVGEAQGFCDFFDGGGGENELLGAAGDALMEDIVSGRLADGSLEGMDEVVDAHVAALGQVGVVQVVAEMVLDVPQAIAETILDREGLVKGESGRFGQLANQVGEAIVEQGFHSAQRFGGRCGAIVLDTHMFKQTVEIDTGTNKDRRREYLSDRSRGQTDHVEVDVQMFDRSGGMGNDPGPGGDEIQGVGFKEEGVSMRYRQRGPIGFIDIKPPITTVKLRIIPA